MRGTIITLTPSLKESYQEVFQKSDICPVCHEAVEDGEKAVVLIEGLYHKKCHKRALNVDS